ncbi:MAG TPA: N-acetyltransferase [Candidatus Woesearchaeota archaeon]|nr:N-acetyltransferase [Candidatus Woesearchaeota archaeon]
MEKIKIRRAKKEDFEKLAELMQGFWDKIDTHRKEYKSGFLKELKDNKTARFLLFDNKELIGNITMVKYWTTWCNGYQMVLEEIVVAPKHRKKGYGLKLLDYAIEYAKKNAKEIWLGTGTRSKAQTLYKKRMKKANAVVYELKFHDKR